MLKLVPTAVLAGVAFVVQIAEGAGAAPVPAPPALGLLTAGAAVIAVGVALLRAAQVIE